MIIYDKEKFGNAIKNIRKAKNYSIKKISAESYISINTIRGIERGTSTPSLSTLSILSTFLKVDLFRILIENSFSTYKSLEKLRLEVNLILESRNFINLDKIIELTNSLIEEDFSNDDLFKPLASQLHNWVLGLYEARLTKIIYVL